MSTTVTPLPIEHQREGLNRLSIHSGGPPHRHPSSAGGPGLSHLS